MNLRIFALLILQSSFFILHSSAQSTDRKFILKNSADGQSEITVYLPTAEAAAQANGRAIVDCPGGGYSHLAMDHEGHDWAEFYNQQGIAFIVLKYRMPGGDRNIPLSDAYQAIRTVRDSCHVWHINPHNVGIQGFSAGGHLASAVSTHAPFDARPDFSILFYPVISMNEKLSHKGSCVGFLGDGRNDATLQREWSSDQAVRRHLTPPAILILANDDRAVPPATNAAAYYTAMRRAGNSCTMFCYPSGGHGFGFRSNWKYHELMKAELRQWLADLRMPAEDDIRVACVGNSITDGSGIDMAEAFGYPAQLRKQLGQGYAVKNFGVGARTMSNRGNHPYQQELAWRDCLAWQPNIVIIKLGTNDSKPENWQYAKDDYTQCLQQMVDSLRSLPSKPRIILASPITAYKPTWNISDSIITTAIMPALQKFAKKQKLEYLELHTLFQDDGKQMQNDGIHPNDKGAAQLADIIAKYIKPKE
ncbi:MAG: alpha/beta hydrolase fold domain-containing protein [Bacteroidaceae bacterium]|nr:alpha/beta hydrolase fold domain-containing protein [Bacteroidaceae bacterium]MBR1793662.1 alpha/beta hydrolase fold domain-containing protein [Bacteroidales bacterium]